jgi:diguanylate cyclase (GGDEF)-like protein
MRRAGRVRDLTLRRGTVIVLIALAVAAVVLWLLGRSIDTSSSAASDSSLGADLQVARATLENDVAAASRQATALAQLTRLQEALARGDRSALVGLAAAHPGTLIVSAAGIRAGALGRFGIERRVDVAAGGKTLGHVVAEAALDGGYLARARDRLTLGSSDVLVLTEDGRVVAGPLPRGTMLDVSSPADVEVAGDGYRAQSTALVGDRPGLRVVALTPRGGSPFLGWRLPLAVLATFAALAAVLMLVFGWHRSERALAFQRRGAPRRRDSPEPDGSGVVALLGETLGATHNPDALLQVILDAAVQASGAVGGQLAPAGAAAVPPGARDGGWLTIPLDTGEREGRSLVLFPPPGGFTPEAADAANWLGVQASTALRNARLHRLVERQAITDELTGLANRRHFTAVLQEELALAERRGTPVAVVLSDLDDFKGVNDRFGHLAGDDVLKAFADTLRRSLREIDLPARIGGEEFAILLPQSDAAAARLVAERLRRTVRTLDGLPRRVTASFGVAAYPQAGSAEELLLTADVSLYQAKEGGRDRVVVAGTPPGHGRSPGR